jgi:DNA-binding transcriptional ArsR family regulator
MDAALRAIAEPTRREILRLVRDGEVSAGEIASHFDVSRPAISQHLKVLKDAGLVTERRQGTMRLYSGRPEGLSEVRAFLEGFWDDRLVELKRAAEREERRATWKAASPPARRGGNGKEPPPGPGDRPEGRDDDDGPGRG